jgi:DNA-directed RNA polymerase specialized sigma24 family protein
MNVATPVGNPQHQHAGFTDLVEVCTDSTISRWDVSNFLMKLENGEDGAAEDLWNRYFNQLVRFVNSRLDTRYRTVFDAEDIAISAVHSFCIAATNKRYSSLADDSAVWRVLVSIAIYKLLHFVRNVDRLKRGGHYRRGGRCSADNSCLLGQITSREPSPESTVACMEQFEFLIKLLDDKKLEQLVVWKMEGYTNCDIAIKLNKSTRTIERKVKLVREIWKRADTRNNL